MRPWVPIVGLLLATSVIGHAEGLDVAPSLAMGRVQGAGWVALKVATLTDTEFVLERHVTPTAGSSFDLVGSGYVLYYEKDARLVTSLGAFGAAWDDGNARVLAGGASTDPLLPGLHDLTPVTLPLDDDVHLGVRGGFVLTVLFWEAGDVAEWTYVLRASNATLLGKTEGPGAYAFDGADFRGLAADAAVKRHGAFAASDARLALQVRDGLVGASWERSEAGSTRLSVRPPSGGAQDFRYAMDAPGLGPGTYEFVLDGAAVRTEGEARYLTLADAVLPP